MSNRFSSALSYLGGHGSGKGHSEAVNKFVGQTLNLNGESMLKVKKVIAEGKSMKVHSCICLYDKPTP